MIATTGTIFMKKNLNGALRNCILGCNATMIDDSIQCMEILLDKGSNINAEESHYG